MAFKPSGQLTLITSANQMITLTPDSCSGNSSIVNGYCACNPTFEGSNETCACSVQHILKDQRCICEEGKYYESVSICEDCSAFCSTCSEGGVGGCDSYSALFIIMIIVIILVVVGGLFAAFYFYKRKKEKKNTLLSKDDKSSDILPDEPAKVDEDE